MKAELKEAFRVYDKEAQVDGLQWHLLTATCKYNPEGKWP